MVRRFRLAALLALLATLLIGLMPDQHVEAINPDPVVVTAMTTQNSGINTCVMRPRHLINTNGIDPRFYSFWQSNGAVHILGLAISDPCRQTLRDGRDYDVQYFERSRLEWHPECNCILLGTFGEDILNGNVGGGQGQQFGPVVGTPPSGFCTQYTDLEALPRWTVTAARMHQWFHPIYDQEWYNESGGYRGQWSWYHTLVLIETFGGEFIHFENNDAAFRFRMSSTQGAATFAIQTNNQYLSQYAGRNGVRTAINVRTMPFSPVQLLNPCTGQVLATIFASRGGDAEIWAPINGKVVIRVNVAQETPQSYEVIVNAGVVDRPEFPGQTINRIDGELYQWR